MTGNDTIGAIQALCMWRTAGRRMSPVSGSAPKLSTGDPAELHLVCRLVSSGQAGVRL